MNRFGSVYRVLIILGILLPYKMYTLTNKIKTSPLTDIFVAIVAFGLGQLLFPVKAKPAKKEQKKDETLIDQD